MHKRGNTTVNKEQKLSVFRSVISNVSNIRHSPSYNMWITTQVLEEFIRTRLCYHNSLWRSSSLLTCIREVNIGPKFTGWVQFTSCVNITCLDQIMYVFFAILVNGSILLLREYMHLNVATHKFKTCYIFMLRRNRCLYKDYIVFSIERNSTYLNVFVI